MNPYLEIVIRSASVYLFLVLAIRLFGRKELSQLSTTDLVFIVLISNSVQNAMVGSNSTLQGGILAATVLFAVNYAFKVTLFKSANLRGLLEDQPIILIHNGKPDYKNLAKQKITDDELNEAIREHGLTSSSQVKLAMLEIDGNISVISGDNQHLKQSHHKLRRRQKSLVRNT